MKYLYTHKQTSRLLIVLNLIIYLLLNTNESFSQNNTELPVFYGSSFSQSFQGTSYNSNFAISLNMIQGRRTFELGVIVDNRDVISGAEFVHKIYLNKKSGHNEFNFSNYNLRPYLIYNLVYHRATSNTQLMNNLIIDGESTIDLSKLEEPEKVTTLEHYLGFGLEKDIIENLYVCVNGGIGLYLGKNNNNNKVDPIKEQHQENGITWNTKLSFGFRF